MGKGEGFSIGEIPTLFPWDSTCWGNNIILMSAYLCSVLSQ